MWCMGEDGERCDFMIVNLHEPLYREMKPCICGGNAEFVYPNDHYTDCYLQCIACGNRTDCGCKEKSG